MTALPYNTLYWRIDPATFTQHAVADALDYGKRNLPALCGFTPSVYWYWRSPDGESKCKRCEEMMPKPEQSTKQNQ